MSTGPSWLGQLLALGAGLMGCATAPVSRDEIPPMASMEAQARGVEYLVAAQNENGSWGSFASARPGEIYLDNLSSHRAFTDATSALCVMAMMEPARDDAAAAMALDRGVEYLLTAAPTGRASGGTFYDTWAHTYLVQAMARLHQDERFIERRDRIAAVAKREIAILAERQGMEGGWGYYDFGYTLSRPTGNMSTSFNTAAALIALHEARQAGLDVPETIMADGLLCLERLRLPSGAYVYGTYAQYGPGALYNRVNGSLGRAQPCNLALWLLGRPITHAELQAGFDALREEHHFIEIGKGRPYPHEAWYFTAGYYFLFGHFYAGLVANELDGEASDAARHWLRDTMIRLQDPDGSWFDFPLYGYHKCYGTAYGLLTLQACDDSDAVRSTAEFR